MKNLSIPLAGLVAAVLCLAISTPSPAQEPAPATPSTPVVESAAAPSTNAAPAADIPVPETAPASTTEVSKVTISEQPPAVIPPAAGKWWDGIGIGTRITYFRLLKEEKNTFLGNIDKLEEKQDYAPDRLFVDWYPTRYVGAELTWDQARAETHNRNSDTGMGDGDFTFSGPILTLMLRYPNETGFTPYGGIGIAFLNCSFENDAWWYYGWPSPDSYEAAGSPKEFRNGYRREIYVKDSNALVLAAGCDYRINDRWSADLYLRYMSLDLDSHYTHGSFVVDPGSASTTTIPFSNVAIGAGVRYTF